MPAVPMRQLRPKAKGGETFRAAFQYVLVNRVGITMTSLPFSKEKMDRELEQTFRLKGGAGDAEEGRTEGPEDEGNTPGTFAILQDNLPVTAEPSASSAVVARLAADTVVVVKEVAASAEERRLRGRIEQPRGWIPLMSTDGSQRWARKQAEAKWSDDAEELRHLVKQLGPRNANLTSEAFVKPFFKHLLLPELNMRELDEDVAKFTSLTYLDVSRNALPAIENLPPNLKFLKAYNTQVSEITCRLVPSLCFLGLGHSPMAAKGLGQAARCFPNLLSLDLSYTQVAGLQEVARHLGPLQRLRHLCLAGSPVCLLPHYRLKTLRWLPQLQVLDSAPVTDEEVADAQHLATSAPIGQQVQGLRLALQPQTLGGARALLGPAAEVILAAKRAAAEAAAAAAAAAGEGEEAAASPKSGAQEEGSAVEDGDPIVEACAGGALRCRFELPNGDWAETAEVPLDAEGAEAGNEEGAPEPFDSFELSKLCGPSGEPLLFEVEDDEAEEVGLTQLCHWVRRGLAVKVFFRPAPPPDPNEAEEEASPTAAAGKGKQSPAPPPKESPTPSEQPPADEPPREPPPLPEEVPIGGAVIPLDTFFWRTQTGMTQEMREAGELPPLPEPWVHEVPDARVVPMDRWLDPEVQVPSVEAARRAADDEEKPAASLAFSVVLYAPGAPEEDGAQASGSPDQSPKAASPKSKTRK